MKIFQVQGEVREFFKKSGNSVFWRNAKAKLNLSECFQPDGVFCFENRASVYFDIAIYLAINTL